MHSSSSFLGQRHDPTVSLVGFWRATVLPLLLGGLVFLLVVFLAGCAGAPSRDSAQTNAAQADALGLYAGVPTVAHATQWPVKSVDEGVVRGDRAWTAGDLDLALYLYVQAANLDTTTPAALLKIGAIHELRGNLDLARKAFTLALERAPDHAATRERLGFVLLRMGDGEAAAREFTQSAALDATRWRAMMGLGLAAEKRRDYSIARVHYDAALKLERSSAELWGYSAHVALQLGELARASDDARLALDLGESRIARYVLGDSIARGGDYPGALAVYLAVMPEARAYLRLGEQALITEQWDRAYGYFERAAHASPTYFEEAHKSMAVARERIAEKNSSLRDDDRRASDTTLLRSLRPVAKIERPESPSVALK